MKSLYCRMAALATAAILSVVILVSAHRPPGTYVDETGTWRLELKSGGKAILSFGGQAGQVRLHLY